MQNSYFFDRENKELIIVDVAGGVRTIPQIVPEETEVIETESVVVQPKKKAANKDVKKTSVVEKKKYQKKDGGMTKSDLILLKYVEGMHSPADLAKATGCSVGSIYSVLSIARRSGKIGKPEKKESVKNEEKDEEVEEPSAKNDYGLDDSVIQTVLEAKRGGETDEGIAFDNNLTVSQVRVLYMKYRNDPKFKD
jgi:hypothetical protein